MKTYLITIVICFLTHNATAKPSAADSLKNELAIAKNDTARFVQLMQLSNFYEQTKPDSSVIYIRQMILLSERSNNAQIMAFSYANYGHEQYILGNYPLALQMLFKALRLAQSVNDVKQAANIYNSIGNTYKEYEDFNRAIPEYLNCLQLSEKTKNWDNALFATMNLGFVYERLNKLDSALTYAQQAFILETKYKIGHMDFVLNTLGNIHSKLNNKNLALEYFKAGIEAAKKDGRTRYLCMNYLDMGEFFRKYNEMDSAIVSARNSLELAREIPYVKGIGRAGKFLSSLYEVTNNTDSAFYYQKLFVLINDSINSRDRTTQMENLSFLEQLRQQENELAKKKLEEKRNQNLQYVLTASAVVVIVFLFLSLTRSVITNTRLIEFLGMIALLIVFEFFNLLLHPLIEGFSNHSPMLMLLALVSIAAVLVPLHHKLEKWATKTLVEKNRKIRLAAAKKTIAQLEKNEKG